MSHLSNHASEFDVKIQLIQEIIKVTNQQSQRMESNVKRAREELQQLKNVIQNKNQSCLRELEPRIRQLEQKIECYWEGVKKMNGMAWRDLEIQQNILEQCQEFVAKLEGSLEKAESKI